MTDSDIPDSLARFAGLHGGKAAVYLTHSCLDKPVKGLNISQQNWHTISSDESEVIINVWTDPSITVDHMVSMIEGWFPNVESYDDSLMLQLSIKLEQISGSINKVELES